MAYNRRNLLKRVIDIQNITLELKRKDGDMFFKTIYWTHIYPTYKISYRTYATYLDMNARKQLKELEEKMNKKAS
ncbi:MULTISPECIES: hypothetical protein [Capnocytophaga]|nr:MULTISPECIES: hypothetical protein [Capnocytophaga]GIJ93517.1 hypothetical protein CAPN002_07350 [Capnocytophaga stomatis]GIM50616.1 hypothetical protein CAPN003_20680 [Capnocytophaga stomatis]